MAIDLDEFIRKVTIAEKERDRKIQAPGLIEAARLLRTDGVLLPIVPGETKGEQVIRFAIAFAEKLERLAAPPEAK
jgi:hypothetical protein